MSDKSVILKNIDGDRIFPIIPYTNIVGAPHPLNGDVTIFYGTGVPVNTKSTYENIKEDDLYIDRDNTYGIGIYRASLVTDTTVTWCGLSNGVYYPDDPINYTTPWYARFQIKLNIGLIYVNSNTGDIFILTGKQVPNLTWTKVTGGNSTNIFYGNGVPTNTKSDYENIKLDDLYIDRNKTYALCIYRCVAIPNPEVVIWQSTESDIKNVGEPPTSESIWSNMFKVTAAIGITYTDTNTGDFYVLTGKNAQVLTWTKVNGDKLPSSTSSDAGKVLTVDPNGDPDWEDLPKSNPIETNKNGNTITLTDSADEKIQEIGIMGKSTQNGTPTIATPIPIVDTTTEDIEVFKKNLIKLSDLEKNTLSRFNCTTSISNNLISLTANRDGEIYIGSYTNTGTYYPNLNRCILVRCSEGQKLFVSSGGVFNKATMTFCNDEGYAVVNVSSSNFNTNAITVPSGATLLSLRVGVVSATEGTTYTDYIQVEVGESKTDYESFAVPQQATLTKTLRGIKVSRGYGNYTDPTGQEWICDTIERYKDGSGKLIRRVARVTLDGSVNWTDYTNPIVWVNIKYLISGESNVIDSIATAETTLFTLSNNVKAYATVVDTNDNSYMIKGNRFYFSPTVNGQRLNATQFKEYLSNNSAELECCLETPIETPLTAEELAQLDLSTYYPITNIISNPDVEITYVADTKNYIDNKFEELQNAIVSQGGNV